MHSKWRNHDVWRSVPEFFGSAWASLSGGPRDDGSVSSGFPATSIARDIEHEYQANIQYVRVDDPLICSEYQYLGGLRGAAGAAVLTRARLEPAPV